MQLQNFYAQDVNGNIVPGAACSLYLPGTTTLASGLEDANGSPLANPFAANGDGLAQFAAPNGKYDLKIEAGLIVSTLPVVFADTLEALNQLSGFLPPSSTPPATREDGTPLQPGDTYFNTTNGVPYIYISQEWKPNESMAAISELRGEIHTSSTPNGIPRANADGILDIGWMSPDVLNRYNYYAVMVSWFSTVPVGGDDTPGLQAALDYAFSNGKVLVIDRDIYTRRVSVNSGFGAVICPTGKIIAHQDTPIINSYDNMLLDFGVEVTGCKFDLVIDLGGKGHSGVFFRGGANKISVDASNSISQTGQISGTRGTLVSGDRCNIPYIKCTNFISIPEQGDGASALTVAGYAKSSQVGRIIAEGGSGALLNNGNGTKVDSIYVDGCLDNAIYDIEDAIDLKIGTVTAINCPDEVVVFNRSTRGRVDTVHAINCGRGVGVTNAISPSIGSIYWEVSPESAIQSGSPLFSRPNQTEQTNELTVETLTVRGSWSSGAPIFSFQNLGVKNLKIGEIDADLTFSDVGATKNLSFFDSLMTTIDIGKLSVTVRDGTGTLTSSDIFILNIIPNTPLGGYSAIGGFKLSNGGGLHSIRAPRVNDPNLVINDIIRVRSDIGTPFAANEDNQDRVRVFYSGSVPTTGAWLRGDIFLKTTPGAAAYMGWECIASGTPGTWKQFGMTEA